MKVPTPRVRPGSYDLRTVQQSLKLAQAARNLFSYGMTLREIVSVVRSALEED